jgi:colicin import membrane protein
MPPTAWFDEKREMIMKSSDCGGMRRWCRMFGMLSLLAACGGSALASDAVGVPSAPMPQAIRDRYPSGSIDSEAQAEQALRDARVERTRVGVLYERNARGCRDVFFMTTCLDNAKEQRRAVLDQVKAVEVEANTYKRQLRVQVRDDAIEQRKKMQEAEAANRPQVLVASMKAPAEGMEAAGDAGSDDPAGAVGEDTEERKRNVVAYRNKVEKAKARQRKVAAKKAAVTQK